MRFVLPTPSLQHVAQVKIVAALWNHPDIINLIAQTIHPRFFDNEAEGVKEWRAIEERVRSNLWALPLPEPCKKQLSKLIQPLGMEILNWRHYHNARTHVFIASKNVLPRQFYWSMRGTIDYAKTAASMVNDYHVADLQRRYEIACINCLENAAGELMVKMGEYRMEKYVEDLKSDQNKRHRDLIMFITYTLGGESLRSNPYFQPLLSRGDSLHQYLFEEAVVGGNRATCEYLFNKLSPGEKTRVLEDRDMTIYLRPNCGALYYFSLMNEEQQRRMLAKVGAAADVLECLLGWPMQALFLEAAQCGLPFLSQEDYTRVLNAIVKKISLGLRDYDYPELFWEFWRSGPAEYRRYFLSKCWNLDALIETKEEEIIKLVVNDAPFSQVALLLSGRYDDKLSLALLDESVVSGAALREWKATAALESSRDKEDEEKRWKSRYLSRFVNIAMDKRIKSRTKPSRSNKKMKQFV